MFQAHCSHSLGCWWTTRSQLLPASRTPGHWASGPHNSCCRTVHPTLSPLALERWDGDGGWIAISHNTLYSTRWHPPSKWSIWQNIWALALLARTDLWACKKMNKHKRVKLSQSSFSFKVTKVATYVLKFDTLSIPAPCSRFLTNNFMSSGWNVNLNFSICDTTNYNSISAHFFLFDWVFQVTMHFLRPSG